ncbi:hypothetical protein OsI_24588 [Oryza sativa Indica Group]|uniref:Uncharacterized protein n=1 Tax=Oryza sativa subsp. indica TaxID=39946 RepID=B8B6J2_ORYSI|nr:hypothetical protein OsI_24588 [Oryza sativa Indica Group]
MDPQQPKPVSYLCTDCGTETLLKPTDVVQCHECGCRILCKKRTRQASRHLEYKCNGVLFSMKRAEDEGMDTFASYYHALKRRNDY